MNHNTQSAQIKQKQDEYHIHLIMKATYSPGYHHSNSCIWVNNALLHIADTNELNEPYFGLNHTLVTKSWLKVRILRPPPLF